MFLSKDYTANCRSSLDALPFEQQVAQRTQTTQTEEVLTVITFYSAMQGPYAYNHE